MKFFWAIFLLLVLGLGFTSQPTSAEGTIKVSKNEAKANFPTGITFSLQAEGANPITEVQLLYGATRQKALTLVVPKFEAGKSIQAKHFLDTQVYNLPPGVDLTYRWLVRDAAGQTLETPPQKLVYHDERFAWQERTARGVTVFWYEGGQSFGDELLETATKALDRLEEDIGATVKDPIKIYIYANNRDMRSAMSQNEVEWVGGQAQPNLGLVLGAIAPNDSAEVKRILPHELSHQVLYQATDNPYGGVPTWFDEGLAVYNQEAPDADFVSSLKEAALKGQLIPLTALAASFPADSDQARLSYAESHSVVSYLSATYKAAKMRELVKAFKEAKPLDEALQTVLGVSVDELEAAWRKTLPAAKVIVTPEAGPASAPADRFSDSAEVEPLSQPSPRNPAKVTLIPGVVLPMWAELGLLATCCLGLTFLLGAMVLITLRLIGVDKRTD